MKPYIHAKNSARKFGGVAEDYQKIHDFIDQSKSTIADMRHRALLHNSLGPFLAEQCFGTTIINSDGKHVSVRDIAEDHILEDLGFIPSVEHWLKNMTMQDWMFGSRRGDNTKKFIPLTDKVD